MKKILLTAAALTLGTSAYAWMPAQDGGSKVAGDNGAAASAHWTQTAMSAWNEMKSGAKVETAAADAVVPKVFSDWTDPTVRAASLDTGAKVASEDGDIQIAENEFKAKDAVDGAMMASTDGTKIASDDGDIQIAENEFKAKDSVDGVAMASAEGSGAVTAAVGGPYEAVTDYPPCRPGPGDDRCIQLYERGVGQSLASAKGAESNVAVGGPYEPVADGAGKTETPATEGTDDGTAMKTDVDQTAVSSSADDGDATMTKPMDGAATATTPGATGGPVETRTGYPPCRPGRGDDSCIQLYERGVATRRK